MINLDELVFPSTDGLGIGHWQPIYFSPNLDSPERLVVGVLSYLDGNWHLEEAKALKRLNCLYDHEGTVAIEAVRLGLATLQEQVKAREVDRSRPLKFAISGLSTGECRDAQGHHASDIARRWLRLCSSLHTTDDLHEGDQLSTSCPERASVDRISRDRLAVLVMDELDGFSSVATGRFHPYIRRLKVKPYSRRRAEEVFVAYTGRAVTANFAAINPGQKRATVDNSKRLMWDLERYREVSQKIAEVSTQYQMYLYRPPLSDPNVSPKQLDNVLTVVDNLTEEGRKAGISVLAYDSVKKIASGLLRSEETIAA